MIRLENLTKIYRTGGQAKVVARDMNAVFPTGAAVALLGRNGAGKSSLLRIIAGSMDPTSGRVVSDGTISWLVGFAGSFHPDLTGLQNTRFVARVYGVDSDALVDFVEEFAELRDHFRMPTRTYSSGMKSRLAFGLSMGIRFDTYLVDEVTAVGDAGFRRKSEALFRERMSVSGAILVSHSMPMLRRNCTSGAVIDRGRLHYYDDLDAAIDHHEAIMGGGAPD